MHFTLLTLFPEMFPGALGHSLAGKALEGGVWSMETMQIRDFASDKHQKVDDEPYGGGAGMVMKPDVIDAAIQAARGKRPKAGLIYFTPRGRVLTQELVNELLFPSRLREGLGEGNLASPTQPPPQAGEERSLILLCSRYEAVDERVIEAHKPLEISLGDYILSGGEMAALTLMDAIIRLLPGVMGADDSAHEESFILGEDSACLLEYPHYTRPPLWDGRAVPEVLLSGNHAMIKAWRRKQAEDATEKRRPDLWGKYKDDD